MSQELGLRFPNDTERMVIIGRTGSGKTQAACYQLSLRDIDRRPWIVFDYKFDKLLGQIEHAQHVTLDMPVPKDPGVYLIHPEPDQDVNDYLMQIWKNENTGVYIDEGYMIGKWCSAYRTLLTQGRSKNIPMITLTQRPVDLDRFTFSEAEYFQVFALTHKKDTKKVEEYVPFNLERKLPKYHSYYYSVNDDQIWQLGPAPDADAILDTFDAKLEKLRKIV